MRLTFSVAPSDNGKRIIDILRSTYGMSSLLAKRIRLYGTLKVDGSDRRMIQSASAGETIFVSYDETSDNEPEDIPDRSGVHILFSDRYIAVASKPAGMVTHPVSNHREGTLTDIYSDFRLHPVSRLDRLTSGLILLARDPYSHYLLACQHGSDNFLKEYSAFCHGIFSPPAGMIVAPIGRRSDTRMLRRVTPDGSSASTEYLTLESWPEHDISYVRFRLHTGKTHQIRVHCLYSGHPIIGDSLYGPGSNENAHYINSMFFEDLINRQALHAGKLEFMHPVYGKVMSFEAALPDDMGKIRNYLRNSGHRS